MTEEPVTRRFSVPSTLAGQRIDRVIAVLLELPRAEAAKMLGTGAVTVDGRVVAKSFRAPEGAVVDATTRAHASEHPSAEPVPVTVRYEDADVVVVAKPAGLVVHPGAGHEHGTLVHGLLDRFPEIADVGTDPQRPGIVHRLDRETSGLMVVARSERAREALERAIAARAVERRYTALVWGHLDSARGVIDAPIGRSPRQRTRMTVREAGKEARTRYEVREVFDEPEVSLLGCELETGRTHQIRVHLAAIGHPVVGDAGYGGRRDSVALARPFLHASALAFAHPVEGRPMRFEEALPDELASTLQALRGSPSSP